MILYFRSCHGCNFHVLSVKMYCTCSYIWYINSVFKCFFFNSVKSKCSVKTNLDVVVLEHCWERVVYCLLETSTNLFVLPLFTALWFLSLAVPHSHLALIVIILFFIFCPGARWFLQLVVHVSKVLFSSWTTPQFGLPCHLFFLHRLKVQRLL